MRPAFLLGAMLLAASAAAQADDDRSLFVTVAPQITIVVKEHMTGADMVQVTLLKSGYPEALLRQQLQGLGKLLGNEPRGLSIVRRDVSTSGRKLDFLTAAFAVNGLIDRPRGVVRLSPIAKAFAGAPAPYTITGLAVMFDGEPLREGMVGRYTKEGAVKVEAMPSLGPEELPAGVEYRVQLLTQDADKIDIPETASPPPPTPKATVPDEGPDRTLVLGLGALAAIAAGVLVYLALLRRAPRGR